MINHSQDRAEVFGQDGMTATNRNGDTLAIYHEGYRQFVSLPRYDTFVTFHYGKASEQVLLQRSFNFWTLLNVYSFGLGFIIDDANSGWRGYDDLYVYLDSNKGVDSSLQLSSLDSAKREDRPRLLISGAWGINSFYGSAEQADIWVPPYYEYSVGLSYRHKWEAFFRASSTFEIGFTPSFTGLEYAGYVTCNSFILRTYPWKEIFIEGGPSFLDLSADSALLYSSDYILLKSYPPQSASIPAISAGIGWSGDFSYVEWHYEYGLKPYQFFDQPSRQFREFVITLGLIFRI